MDESKTLSFDHAIKTPEIEMLNAALPYVSDQMRKPLALYIKSTEMRHILSDFDSEEILSACGSTPNPPDPESMLKAMKLAGGKNAGPTIDQLLQMMHMVKTYQKINEMIQNNPEMMTFLNNMLNQSPSSVPTQSDKIPHSATMDPSDMMNILTQMLKNSR